MPPDGRTTAIPRSPATSPGQACPRGPSARSPETNRPACPAHRIPVRRQGTGREIPEVPSWEARAWMDRRIPGSPGIRAPESLPVGLVRARPSRSRGRGHECPGAMPWHRCHVPRRPSRRVPLRPSHGHRWDARHRPGAQRPLRLLPRARRAPWRQASGGHVQQASSPPRARRRPDRPWRPIRVSVRWSPRGPSRQR